MNRLKSNIFICLVVAANGLVAGCDGGSPAPAGLELTTVAPDRVAGSYREDGLSIGFDLSRDDFVHTATYRREDGSHLVTTTLDGSYQTITVLHGRLVVAGTANAPDPEIEGDRAAMDELYASPEVALMEGLIAALGDAGIDPELYSPVPAEPAITDGGDGFFYFQPGEWRNWSTAAFGAPTYVTVKNESDTSCATVRWWISPGFVEYQIVNAGAQDTQTRYWWGALLSISNVPFAIDWGTRVCQPTEVGVRVKLYTW